MSLAVGAVLAAGVLLIASPWLWPDGLRMRRMLERFGPLAALKETIQLAGLPERFWAAFLSISVITAAGTAAIVHAVCQVNALTAVAAVVGLLTPFVIVRSRASGRRRLQRSLWPDVVDHLVSGVRSGLALPDSIAALAAVGPLRLQPAFGAFARDYGATGNFSAGLDRLKATLADPVADRIIETLRMAREVGGTELPAVLRALSAQLREDSAVRAEAEARQSWVRNAARLGVAAPWLILGILAARPEAAAAYNSRDGAVLIVGGVIVSVFAYQLMLRLGRLQTERRWFR